MTADRGITAEEQSAICSIRERLGNRLPADLDTDLNLQRWFRGYHGDIDKIASVIPEYVASRQAAGFDGGEKHIERYFQLPSIKPYLPHIASSRLYDNAWSDTRNAFVFVEKAWAQPKEFVKVMKTSDYLFHCFGYSEFLLQLILRKEREVGRRVTVLTIFDLADIHIHDYLNPISHHLKLWKLRSELWQDWYPEILQKIIVVNPPRLIHAIWSLSKLFLNERNRALLHLAHSNKDIEHYVEKDLIPVAYGGRLKCPLDATDDSCCSKRRKITAADYYVTGEHYRKAKRFPQPERLHADIGANQSLEVSVMVSNDESAILWDFHTNGDLEFSVVCAESRRLLYPNLKLFTGKVAEEGTLGPLPAGEYRMLFHNTSHYFHAKIDYAVCTA